MSVQPPVIIEEGSNPPEIVTTDSFAELLFTGSASKGFEAKIVDGPTGIVAAKPLKNASIKAATEKGETLQVGIEATKVEKSTFKATGKGDLNFQARTGTFIDTKIKGTKGSDSIKFGSKTKLNGVDIVAGKGSDTVTFGGNTKSKFKGGDSTIDLGKGGKDVVEFTNFKAFKKGGLTIENFDKKDKLIINDQKFGYNKLQKEDFKGIEIDFAD